MSDCLRSWADIDEEIFTAIVSRASTRDKFRCHAVCKNCSALIQKPSLENYALPWLMLFGWKEHPNPTICHLFDPSEQKRHAIEQDLSKRIFTRQERRGIDMMRICGYKNGWVIFHTSRQRRRYGSHMRVSIDCVIYHLHSRLFVRLPELLRTSTDWKASTATSFSSTPTSSDCVFLSLHASKVSTGLAVEITISSYLAADQTWNESTVVDNNITNDYIRGLVYLDGTFYCLFLCGEFRSFHVATRKWGTLPSISGWEKSLLVFNGQLLCPYVNYDKKYAVVRFNFSQMNWVEAYLSGLVLFVGDHSSFGIQAIAREMPTTINVYDDGDGHHYSYRVGMDQVRNRDSDSYYKPLKGEPEVNYRSRRATREVHPGSLHVYSSLSDELEFGSLQPIWIPPVLFSVGKEDANRAIELKNGSSKHVTHRASLEQQHAKRMQVADSSDATKAKNISKANQPSILPVSEAKDGYSDVTVRKEMQPSNLRGSGNSPEPRKPTKVSIDLVDKELSSGKQRLARTVIFGGLLNDDMAEAVHLRAREVGTVCSITYPLPNEELKQHGLSQDGCKLATSGVLDDSVREARSCVAKLHQNEIKGGMVWARKLGSEGSKTLKWKLIVKNLPSKADAHEIKDLFSQSGFVWDVFVPHNSETGLSKGFAFIKFTSKQDAENAIKKFNGAKIGKRTIAVDWAVSKKVHSSGANASAASEGGQESEGDGSSEDLEDVDDPMPGQTQQPNEDLPTEFDFDKEVHIARKVLENLMSSSSKDSVPSHMDDVVPHKGNNEPIVVETENLSGITLSGSSGDGKPIDSKQLDGEDLQRTVYIPFDLDNGEVKQRFSAFGQLQSFIPVLHQVTKRQVFSSLKQ